jgi:hypothetical protein
MDNRRDLPRQPKKRNGTNAMKSRKRTRRTTDHRLRAGLAFLAATALLSVPALADQIVYFVNGKAMTVKSIEKGAKFTVLEVDGGGRVGVPTDQIARIEDLETISPYVAQAPAAQAAVPPAAVPALVAPPGGTRLAIPPTAGSPPLAAAGLTGPGIGGYPSPTLGQVRPLDIGGSEGASAQRLQPGPAYGAYGGAQAGAPAFGGAQRPYGIGGAMQQPGTAGARRLGGPAMGGRRAGMGRPHPDLSRLQPPQAGPAPQATPPPAARAGGANNQPEDNESGSPSTDDNSPEPQDPSQDPPEQGAENAPPVD